MIFFLSVVCLLALLLLIELAAEQHDLRKYPAPGRFVPANGKRFHIVEEGQQWTSGPTVVLEAGLAATSLSWVFTPPLLAKFARVLAYDRAGLGRSSGSDDQPLVNELVADLHAVIAAMKPVQPIILVGHSFGGLIIRAFANRYPEMVSGLVLVDPVSLITYAEPDRHHRKRLALATRLSRRGALLARLAIVRSALYLVARGQRRLPAVIARVSAGKGSSVMDRLAGEIAKLPPETHGPIRAHWSKPSSFTRMAEYLRLLPLNAVAALEMPVPTNIPMIVLSAASATSAELVEREDWTRAHPASRHMQVPNTTHWLQLDRPDLVASAVKELLSRTR